MLPWLPASTSADAITAMRDTSLAKVVRDDVLTQILRGELMPGQRINEPDVSTRLKVSRVPVREALRELESSGLVVSKKNSGVFVRQLSEQEVADLYEMRAVLDTFAGAKAAGLAKGSRAALTKQVQQSIKRMKALAATKNIQAYYAENLHFHWLIVEAAGNQALQDSYRSIVQRLHLARLKNLAQDVGMAHSIAEHELIADALAQGDAQATQSLMSCHVNDAFGRLRVATKTTKTSV